MRINNGQLSGFVYGLAQHLLRFCNCNVVGLLVKESLNIAALAALSGFMTSITYPGQVDTTTEL